MSGGLLIVAPHGMDEVLGCGGSMRRAAAAGRAVETLVLFGDGLGADAEVRAAGPRAAAVLGVPPPRYADLPENRSDSLTLADVVRLIERAVGEIRPEEVWIPHGGSLHIDHQTAHRAVCTAVRPAPGVCVRVLRCYEIPSSTDWAPAGFAAPFVPNRFVGLEPGDLEAKSAAMAEYAAQGRPWPHARSAEAVVALARLRGASVGLSAAEAFATVREIVPALSSDAAV
jgi:N-acetylglucosamine malate deacetylase 1